MLASFVGIIGIAFLILAYFESNPIKIEEKDIVVTTYTLQENPPLVLGDIKKLSTTTDSLGFGEKIETNYLKREPSRINLNLKIGEFNQIVEFNSSDENKILRTVSSEYKDIKLYNDNSVSAYTIRPLKSEQVLWLNTGTKASELIISNKVSEELITSYYFEPTQKIFYLSSYNNGGVFYIALILNNKSIYPFFETTLLDSNFKIVKVDINKNTMYLKSNSLCKELNMNSKELKEIKCDFINTSAINFKVFVEGSSMFKIDNNLIKTRMIDLDSLYFYDQFYIKDNFVYYVKSLKSSIENKKLMRINLDNLSEEEVISKLPNILIKQLFILDDSIYLITDSTLPKLLKYFPKDLTPVSYAQFPVSMPYYAKPYIKTSFQNWYEIDLGFIVNGIQVME